jgi:hypothetical protein
MRLKIAAAAVDAALEILSDPELTHAPGRKHWAEARRLLVDVRGEILAGLDMLQGVPSPLGSNWAQTIRRDTSESVSTVSDDPRKSLKQEGTESNASDRVR